MNQIYKPLNKNVYVNYHKESENTACVTGL